MTRYRKALPLLSIALVLCLWQAAVAVFDIEPFILPPPTDIARALVDNIDYLLENTWITLLELGLGYGLGFGCGLLLAVVMNLSSLFKAAVYPIVVASQTIPKVAIAPLFVVWFGVDLLPKVLIIALLAFFPILINTVSGLDAADRGQLELMRSVNAGPWAIYRHVKIPTAVPFLFAGMKLALTVSVIGTVIAEWVASSSGLGFLLLAYNSSLQTTELFAALVVLIAISGLAFVLLSVLERTVSWQARANATSTSTTVSPSTRKLGV